MGSLDILDRALGLVVPIDGDEDPKTERRKIRRWRALVGLFVLVMGFHVAWACGLLPNFSGFAVADAVDRKVEAARADLLARLEKQEQRVQRIEDNVAAVLKLQIESRLRDLAREVCASTSPRMADLLEGEIASLQNEHQKLADERYPLPACRP